MTAVRVMLWGVVYAAIVVAVVVLAGGGGASFVYQGF